MLEQHTEANGPAAPHEDRPAPSGRRTGLAQVNMLLELAVKIGLIAGGIIATIQYFDAKQDRRVERTLDYAKRFEEEPMLGAHRILVNVFREQARNAQQLEAAPIDEESALEEEHKFVRFLRVYANGHGVESEIDIVVQFMDSLDKCIQSQLCDRRVATEYFTPFARQLTRNLRYYIKDERAHRTSGYAGGLERVAKLEVDG